MKLIGYKNSWDAKIFATKDHNNVVCVLKRQKNKIWSIEHECDEFKNAVYDCVLWKSIEQAHHKFDDVTGTAFAKRYYPETDTFLLPFSEMAITPNDCYRITGLPITGTSVRAGYDPNMIFGALEKLVEKCLGWDSTKAQYEFRKAAKKPKRGDELNPFNADRTAKKMLKKIKLNTLFDEFSGTRDKVLGGKLVMTEEKLTHHVTAYLLYQLGTIFFPDTSGAAVNAHYLQLLDPLGEVNNYCWGIAVISFVQAELRKSSRLKSLYFGGLYTLVQVWVYNHFTGLKLSHSHDP
ncbi:protein MAINTENANCE OF MERISTEMS-like [Papaver somniferum]|uniref:protein MAINTENANCE OF MERISTEMS-like n=1 Tax=Papaver somniferum TaxID=3469 RepID=UPI000E6FA2C8|nr:protein MAINTENANCE OF MERISTEMS-like [Papaver somniferum]